MAHFVRQACTEVGAVHYLTPHTHTLHFWQVGRAPGAIRWAGTATSVPASPPQPICKHSVVVSPQLSPPRCPSTDNHRREVANKPAPLGSLAMCTYGLHGAHVVLSKHVIHNDTGEPADSSRQQQQKQQQ